MYSAKISAQRTHVSMVWKNTQISILYIYQFLLTGVVNFNQFLKNKRPFKRLEPHASRNSIKNLTILDIPPYPPDLEMNSSTVITDRSRTLLLQWNTAIVCFNISIFLYSIHPTTLQGEVYYVIILPLYNYTK